MYRNQGQVEQELKLPLKERVADWIDNHIWVMPLIIIGTVAAIIILPAVYFGNKAETRMNQILLQQKARCAPLHFSSEKIIGENIKETRCVDSKGEFSSVFSEF